MYRKALLGAVIVALAGGGECANLPGSGRTVRLKFAAQAGDDEIVCGQMFSNLGTSGEPCELLDLRLFVSNIRLIDSSGAEVPLALEQDGRWQVENVALLDFEDASGGCSDAGTSSRNAVVRGNVPQGQYGGIVFEVGVPFELNHSDMTAASAPLNVSAMFWTWAVGRKFLRVDLRSESGTSWNVHLGSTMCESDGSTDPPVAKCGRPNRATISLSTFDIDHDVIVLDLHELLAGVDLSQDTDGSSPGCQSFSDDAAECALVFPSLGLDFDTGECIDGCAGQTAFRVESGITRGMAAFTRERQSDDGQTLACANCHSHDGSGDVGPDIRSSTSDHILEHPGGTAPHPVRFSDLTPVQANDIAVYLASVCEADPACVPGSTDAGHHGDDHDDGDGDGDDHDHEDHGDHDG